jgi:hypothetical protein
MSNTKCNSEGTCQAVIEAVLKKSFDLCFLDFLGGVHVRNLLRDPSIACQDR